MDQLLTDTLYILSKFKQGRLSDQECNRLMDIMQNISNIYTSNMSSSQYGELEIFPAYPCILVKTMDSQVVYKQNRLIVSYKTATTMMIQTMGATYKNYLMATQIGLYFNPNDMYDIRAKKVYNNEELQKINDWISAMFYWDLQSQATIDDLIKLYDYLVSDTLAKIMFSMLEYYNTPEFDKIDISWLYNFGVVVSPDRSLAKYSIIDENSISRQSDETFMELIWENGSVVASKYILKDRATVVYNNIPIDEDTDMYNIMTYDVDAQWPLPGVRRIFREDIPGDIFVNADVMAQPGGDVIRLIIGDTNYGRTNIDQDVIISVDSDLEQMFNLTGHPIGRRMIADLIEMLRS